MTRNFSQKNEQPIEIIPVPVERTTEKEGFPLQHPVEWPVCLVKQGTLVYENLMKLRKSEPWLREALSQLQIYDIRDVRYASYDQAGDLHVLFS